MQTPEPEPTIDNPPPDWYIEPPALPASVQLLQLAAHLHAAARTALDGEAGEAITIQSVKH